MEATLPNRPMERTRLCRAVHRHHVRRTKGYGVQG